MIGAVMITSVELESGDLSHWRFFDSFHVSRAASGIIVVTIIIGGDIRPQILKESSLTMSSLRETLLSIIFWGIPLTELAQKSGHAPHELIPILHSMGFRVIEGRIEA